MGVWCERRVADKEDAEAKGDFGPELLPSQEGGRRQREGGRERPAFGQAPAGGLGEDPRPPRRERPLPPGSELQVLSPEAEEASALVARTKQHRPKSRLALKTRLGR